jgi:hypothetical protein
MKSTMEEENNIGKIPEVTVKSLEYQILTGIAGQCSCSSGSITYTR